MSHLIQTYALGCGAKIDKPFIYEKYFPLQNIERWLTFQPMSKPSKSYSHWRDVISILKPILDKANISILQLGAKNEPPIPGTVYLAGQTNLGQMAFLIKNGLLHLGCDSLGIHYASHFQRKIVGLYSNNYINCVGPFFSKPEDIILFEPVRKNDEKPSFSLEEVPKSIDTIYPELIAESVCKLLNLEFNYQYKTIYTGNIYLAPMIISACDSVINPAQIGINNIIMDLTLNHDENILLNQLNICECSIVTDKPLSDNVFLFHKQTRRIKEIIYEIKEDNSPEFARKVIHNGVPFRMITQLSEEKLQLLKLDYYEIGVIWPKNKININDIVSVNDRTANNIYFKSGKFYTGRGYLYPSKEHYKQNKPISNFDEIVPIIDSELFYDELESFRLLNKVN